MPRPLVFSNGSLFLGLDADYAVRDLFFPQIGRYNHLNGHRIRMGVWLNGAFSWIHEKTWQKQLAYRRNSLVGCSKLANDQLEIEAEEAVSHRGNCFVRKLTLTNKTQAPLEVRLFFSHDLRIMEYDIGDTAFYHPGLDGIVHYKGPCHFLFGGEAQARGPYQYATGLKGFQHFEGTWRDAEDGELGMNPIAQGSVDSTISFNLTIPAKRSEFAHYWIVAAENLDKLDAGYRRLRRLGPEKVIEDTHKHWQTWTAECEHKLHDLPAQVASLAQRSLLTVRAQIDNGGAIIAATDSDIMETNRANYCYMWPRDGALVASVLDEAGQHHLPRSFIEFCARILPKNPAVLLQKYTADGHLGATWHPWNGTGETHAPFQQDETALMIKSIWEHHQAFPDRAALQQHYDRFVRPAADFLAEYRDPSNGLPKPSYDLWEERLGIHTCTVATVIAGLESASKIAAELERSAALNYAKSAKSVRSAMQRLVSPQSGVFLRRLYVDGGKLLPDWTADASTLMVGLLGILPVDDRRVQATARLVERKLSVKGLGGIARYEGDYYFRRHDDLPGNPWIICTCWLAQHKILSAQSKADLKPALKLMQWCVDRAAPTGILPEQVDARTGEAISVSPLTWSHAEFLKTCFAYARRACELAPANR